MNADAKHSIKADIAHHVHPQSNLRQHAEKGPTMITHGKGVFIYDSEGREIIDGFSGLGCVSLGYHNERLADAAMGQMNTLPFAPTFYNRSHPRVAELGERLIGLAPGGMNRVMFQCSGSEANDTAIKLLWYTNTANGNPNRRKIIGRVRGYHGNTVATVSLSGQPHMHRKFGLPLPEFKHTELPNYYRFHIDGESEIEFSNRMAAHFEDLVLSEGPETVAAFFAEPAISGGGALMPPEGYWDAMQAVLRKYDIKFVADEVVCGFGRTGNLWGSQTWGLKPDMVSCAKALSAAFFPISALMFKDEMYADMMKNSDEVGVFGHGYTYAGHPVGAAVALEALDIYDEIDLVGHVRKVSETFLARCRALSDHPLVAEVRGVGLFCGLELMKDATKREPFDPSWKVGELVQNFAHDRGLYLRAIGDRMSFMPPLIIKEYEIEIAADRFKAALDDAWAVVRGRV
ncbi:aminotransferase [Roseibium album]|uniref:Taurine--pyruvate aminotransferase n=1 Tax=Roseibium album TaxID=311410 RepID=A0A0M6ZP11_9HYPH|nr:aminotransferase [Roseibium album]CTQ63163.1 Taurine--pyruvate aminotransferase [Roseibium album]CTQ79320.1 Taurine--pyruvate aminotransferase [Roseibium album]CTQ80741.1 Taurine--pyruvate aminotransferase [Roseibium album]